MMAAIQGTSAFPPLAAANPSGFERRKDATCELFKATAALLLELTLDLFNLTNER